MAAIAKYTEQCVALKQEAEQIITAAGLPFSINHDDDKPIKLVFAGQYSAGKSSIIKMLTRDESIAIGAGITTQVAHSYKWHGIEIVDTPGIHTEQNQDHDTISYAEIASADALVFVITNELFDSNLVSHFKKLAIEHDKAAEMILVVNKMDRTTNGNTTEQQAVIREALRSVLLPYTPEQLRICFVDANSYLESIEEEDPEYAHELRQSSGYDAFVSTLDSYLTDKGTGAKLTTVLYLIQEQAQIAMQSMTAANDDNSIRALEEHYAQQRHKLTSARMQIQDELRQLFTDSAAKIRELGRESADMLSVDCKEEDFTDSLRTNMAKTQEIIEDSQAKADQILHDSLNALDQEFIQLENNEFSKKLKIDLLKSYDALPPIVQQLMSKASAGATNLGKKVLDYAYKPNVTGGFKLSNFSGGTIHEWIVKAGHKIGYKFRPWQAVKLAKGVAVGSQILGAVGVGVSIFTQIKSDQDEAHTRAILTDNRRNIRREFNDAAAGLEEFGREYIKQNCLVTIDSAIAEVDTDLADIRSTRQNQTQAYKAIENISNRCQRLIREIHSEVK